jgi:pimeloyl-ACP methyl ester carboxylesterase
MSDNMRPLRPPTSPSPVHTVNQIAEQLAGRDRRTLFGGEGRPDVPQLNADSLHLSQPDRARLQQTRVYLVPGTPWLGVAEQGGAWTKPWAEELRRQGVGHVVPLNYGAKSDLGTFLKIFTDPLVGGADKALVKQVEADLKAKPLVPGERIVILGHSYGSLLGGKLAERFSKQGLPIAGMVMMETHLPDIGQFVKRAPAIPKVVEVDNEARTTLKVPAKTRYQRMYVPQVSHMEMVLRPPATMMQQIVREIASP